MHRAQDHSEEGAYDVSVILVNYNTADLLTPCLQLLMSYTVRGKLEVEDTLVRVEMMLPWMLAVFAERLKLGVEKQGQVLLEKPRA